MPEIDQITLEQLQRDASAANDLKTRLEKAEQERTAAQNAATEKERQYNSVQGNLVTVTAERKKLQEDLATLSSNTEQTKAQILAEKQELEKKIKEKEEQETTLQTKLSARDEEFEVLKLIATQYPDLADWYGKGRIVPNGKKGDELKTFLDGWNKDLEDSNLARRREGGMVPPPPPGGQLNLSFTEVQDKKNEAAKLHGYNSKEYKEFAKIEEQLFQEGKYK